MPAGPARPDRAALRGARDRPIADTVAPGLDVLLCGINPSLWSGATGHHFARPGNRFWPALHDSGFTPRLLRPDEQALLLCYRIGVTNLVNRATARADELTDAELRDGCARLTETATRYRPCWVAVVGVTAYRVAFARPAARIGRQEETIAGTALWVLPNPSGLNAHYTAAGIAREFALLRAAAGRRSRGPG
ncbi:MAG: G/U mismatch-specific DNA glycosylase [Mycobacteriales bacterium]